MPGFVKDEAPAGLRLERLLQRASFILDIHKGANKEEIKAAFVKMVWQYHPDTSTQPCKTIYRKRYSLQTLRGAKDLLIKQFQDGE